MNSKATEKDRGISNLLLQHHHYLQAQKYEGWRAQAATLKDTDMKAKIYNEKYNLGGNIRSLSGKRIRAPWYLF